VGIYDPAQTEEDARRDVADGFTAVKTGAWGTDAALPEAEAIATFAERVARLLAAVGPHVDIMIDNHGRSRPSAAVRLMEALQPYRLFWLEEPTPPDDREGLARVRAAGPRMDIATGERLYSKWDYVPLLERRLVDVIQPDLCHAGGISECKKIAALAEAHYVQVAPHSPQGPVSTAAAAHLALAIPNFLILEFVRAAPYRDRALREPWPVREGHLVVPDRPGLGVELNEEALAASPPRSVGVPRGAWAADGSVADV
jgi:galactonate dehydratase